MALSTGQVNDAYQKALGRMPTGSELQSAVSRNDLEGSPGQELLMGMISGGSYKPVVSAESIIAPVQDKLKEQITFLKDFLEKTPLAFDEVLARQMAQEQNKPMYEQILNDFVAPLQERISKSREDEQRLLTELVRQKGVGTKEIRDTVDTAVSRAREGFAGAGLLGSGIEAGVSARKNIAGQNKLNDFLSGNINQQETVKADEGFARTAAESSIARRKINLFGESGTQGEYGADVATDVEAQRGVKLKQRGLSTLEAISSRFGSPLPEIPTYLSLYNT